MPSRSSIALLTLPGWVKGLNRDADPSQLGVDESPDALNVDFGSRGSAAKRKGYVGWDTTPVTVPRRMATWNVLGGSEHLFYVADDGTVFNGTSSPLADSLKGVGSWSTVGEYAVAVASLNDVIYFTALGTITVPSFDGSTWADVTATVFDGTASRFPRAAWLATHHERIFAANVMSGSARFASRIYWSDPLDAETWTASNFIDFDPDDGQEITALVSFGESLMVFKNHSVQLLTGKSEESFSRYRLDSEIGTEAGLTVVPFSGRLYFFDPSSGIWSFDGGGFNVEDEGMNQYILDGQNRAHRQKAFAYIYQNKYYLAVPWGADTHPSRTFVKDLRTGSWAEYDYGVHAAAILADTPRGGGPRNTAGIVTLHSGLDDDGAAITARLSTAWLVPADVPSIKYRLRRLDSVWTAIGDVDVTMRVYRDFNTVSWLYEQMIDTDPGGSVYGTAVFGTDDYGAGLDEVLSRTTGWGNARWRALQLSVLTEGLTDDWELNRVALVVSSLDRVRGET